MLRLATGHDGVGRGFGDGDSTPALRYFTKEFGRLSKNVPTRSVVGGTTGRPSVQPNS